VRGSEPIKPSVRNLCKTATSDDRVGFKKKRVYFYPGIKQVRLGENEYEAEMRCS